MELAYIGKNALEVLPWLTQKLYHCSLVHVVLPLFPLPPQISLVMSSALQHGHYITVSDFSLYKVCQEVMKNKQIENGSAYGSQLHLSECYPEKMCIYGMAPIHSGMKTLM